jgi:hypothetical protein
MTKRKKKEWNLTDAQDMTPLDKGEILYHHKMGKKPKEIAGITGRSMEWIKLIVGGLASWRGMDKLINMYIDKLSKEEGKNDRFCGKSGQRPIDGSTGEPLTDEECKAGTKVQGSPNRSANKSNNSGTPKRKVSAHSRRRRRTVQAPVERNDSSGSDSKRGIAAKSRKHKDYKGD